MKELVFNIKNIFNTGSDGCLGQYDVEKYHIPAYQRGYKWASLKNTDAVPILLDDLWEAFKSSENSHRKEYYMQYITVKKIGNEYLEVIDGQQRLTTFSILLSVFYLIINEGDNYAKDKLEYAIRDNFFKEHIYDKFKLQVFINESWNKQKGITLDENDINKQDIYYLHCASKKIYEFLTDFKVKPELSDFLKFILDFVKIIVNEVEPHIDSERVFRNLNSNKVALTEAELIKGLLLTKAARISNEQDKQKHFREILEIRASLGRQWDEIASWVNDKKVKHFFFSKDNSPYTEKGFNELLAKLLGINKEPISVNKALFLLLLSMTFRKDTNVKDSKYLLFNYFHKQTKNIASSNHLLVILKEIYCILKDWYQNDDTYNLLGYLFFVKGSNVNRINFITKNLQNQKDALNSELISLRNNLIPDNLAALNYEDNDFVIHRVLLAMCVFETSLKMKTLRFDYYHFTKNTWSLEHIFPQSPEGKWRGENHILTDDEKTEVIKMIGNNITDEISNLLSKQERSEDEKNIYYKALQKSGINSMGNMSLLTIPDNSSNGCAMFHLKRENVNELIQSGRFVPRHTFEVFNKIKIKSSSISKWSKDDADNHFSYLEETITKLKSNTK